MNTEIRAAGAADSTVLARLRYEFRAAFAPPAEAEGAFVERCRRWMAERLEPGGGWRCWIAERGGEAVGHVWLQVIEKVPNPVEEPEAHAYITNMYVRERERGRGIGTELLTRALGWCRERGDIHAVILWPTERSRPLYERHGFGARENLMELVL